MFLRGGAPENVAALLQAQCNVNEQYTPPTFGRFAAAQLLLEAGARVDLRNSRCSEHDGKGACGVVMASEEVEEKWEPCPLFMGPLSAYREEHVIDIMKCGVRQGTKPVVERPGRSRKVMEASNSLAADPHAAQWKSSAILTYAEEALEQVPANLKVPKDSLEKTTSGNAAPESRPLDLEEIKVWKDKLRKEIGVLRKELDEQGKSTSSLQQFWNDLSKEGLNVLPSKLQSLPNKVVHLNMARVSSSPPVTWRTSCGWHFYGSSFNFVSAEVELTCSKCKSFAQTQRG
eukprot:Skav227268  [mRNA]  locus=scaffold3803:8842:31458:- [translate_table: standard]